VGRGIRVEKWSKQCMHMWINEQQQQKEGEAWERGNTTIESCFYYNFVDNCTAMQQNHLPWTAVWPKCFRFTEPMVKIIYSYTGKKNDSLEILEDDNLPVCNKRVFLKKSSNKTLIRSTQSAPLHNVGI
jgi:hypothetical protein